MKISSAMLLAVTVLMLQPVSAAPKDCEELKAEIAAKIDANGVKSYTLEIVPAAEADAAKVVGSCENSSKRIEYTKH